MANKFIQDYIQDYATTRVVTQGSAIFKSQKLTLEEMDDELRTAIFTVANPSSNITYEVTIDDYDTDEIYADCECPAGSEGELCKHSVAALMYLEQVLEEVSTSTSKKMEELLSEAFNYSKKIADKTETPPPVAPDTPMHIYRLGNLSTWYLQQVFSWKKVQDAVPFISNNTVTLTPGKDKSVTAQVIQGAKGKVKKTQTHTVFLRKEDNSSYVGHCTCGQTMSCLHTVAAFISVSNKYGQDGFEAFKDWDIIKNTLLEPYGYSLADDLKGRFEFLMIGSTNISLKIIDKTILPLSEIAARSQLRIQTIAPGDRGLSLNSAKAVVPPSGKVGADERIRAFLIPLTTSSFELYLIDGKPTKERDDIASKVEVLTTREGLMPLKLLGSLDRADLDILEASTMLTNENIQNYCREAIKVSYPNINNWTLRGGTPEQQVKLSLYLYKKANHLFMLLAKKRIYTTPDSVFSLTRAKIEPMTVETSFQLQLRFKAQTTGNQIVLEGEAYHKKLKIKLDNAALEFPLPYCLLYKNTLYHLQLTPEQLPLLSSFIQRRKMTVHTSMQDAFVTNILEPMQRVFDLETDLEMVGIETIAPTGIRQLYLKEVPQIDALIFHPVVVYNDIQVELNEEPTHTYMGGENTVQIERDTLLENGYKQFLTSLHPEFAEQEFFYDDGCYYWLPLSQVLEKSWFVDFFASLREHEIEIFGFSNLKRFKYNTNKPALQMRTSSGVDWFDMQGDLMFGDIKVNLRDLQKAIFRRDNFVKLADGSLGLLPEEWLEKYSTLFRMGEVKGDRLRLSKMHFSLLEQLYDKIDETAILEELSEKRQKLQKFKNITATKTPEGITATLRPYQKEGLNWLNFLHEFNWGGILADDMGLGKTLQIITFFQHLRNITGKKQTHLVVAPTSLIYNWESEVEKFAPELSCLVYHGAMRKETEILDFSKVDIVITTYGTAANDIEKFQKFKFNYLVLDESQAIKNAATQRYKAMRLLQSNNRLCMSGTPVENNTFDLYAQFNFLNPGMLGSMEHFREQYATPIDKSNDVEKSLELRRLTQPFMLRRTKELVAKDLPEKTEIILYCEMDKAQRKVYNTYRDDIRQKVMGTIETEGMAKAGLYILQGLLRLRQICDSPNLVSDDEVTGFEDNSIKLQELKEHITERTGNHKMLVFSQFKGMLSLIREMLERANISFLYLDGSTPPTERRESVKKFQNDEHYRVFLISLKAGGTGLNLTAADYVYLVDPWWNPAVEQQAIDRTHRIGQVNHVFAYKMICKDSIEEKILLLQAKKKALAADLVASEAGMMKSLTKDDVAFLFS